MAGSRRRTLADQWRPEESGFDRHTFRPSPARNLRASRSRSRSLSRDRVRRRRPSLSPPRDTDTYRPDFRNREHIRSPSPRHYPRERSPIRNRAPREHSRDRRRGVDGHYSPSPTRRRPHSPPRRRSPDSYIPSTRRRSRSPISSSYRPRRTPSPSQHYRPSSHRHSTRKRKASRSPPRPSKHSTQARRTSPRRPQEDRPPLSARDRAHSRSPRRSSRRERRKLAARSRSARRHREREDLPEQERQRREDDMSYPYPGHRGRGGSYGPPRPHDGPQYGSATPFMSAHQNSASASPYTPNRGGYGGYSSYQGSPTHGYPPSYTPNRHGNYPPAGSPHYYGPGPPSHGSTSPYGPPHGYPPHHSSYDAPPSRRGSFHGPPDRRHSNEGRGGGERRGKRGMFQNLSWTPSTGSRGGVQLPPKNRNSSRDASVAGDDEDDNPFRPSKDLQSEDQGFHRDREKGDMPPPKAETNKISFSINSKRETDIATSPTTDRRKDSDPKLSSESVKDKSPGEQPERAEAPAPAFSKRKREPRKELRQFERIKPRPTIDPEHVSSDSVYFRKPGNESVVGSGTYGKVFKAIHVYTKGKVALKKIRMEGERDGFPVTAIREVKLLQSLNNDNVVKLQEVMVERNDCYMVFEYLSHDLTGLLNHPTFRLTHAHKKHLAKQLFEGLDYLHGRGVLHRDIKAANILISSNGQLKLADFGLARFYIKRRQLDYTNRVITIWYRSPELLLGETQYGPAVDIWSAACVLVEIFTKHAIFPGDGTEISQLDRIWSVLGTPSLASWPGMKELQWFELLRPSTQKESVFEERYCEKVTEQAFKLLEDMFAFDPAQRPTAAEVLQHAYFIAEEPPPQRATELAELDGDWHEFESKALRKDKERQEREARRAAREADERKKRQSDAIAANAATAEEREAKRPKLDEEEDDGEALLAPPP